MKHILGSYMIVSRRVRLIRIPKMCIWMDVESYDTAVEAHYTKPPGGRKERGLIIEGGTLFRLGMALRRKMYVRAVDRRATIRW